MKKVILLFITLFSLTYLKAQDFTDALRFANDEINGTARFRAMGGAFGALGGDMSAININPASSVVFSQSEASFSLDYISVNNETNYYNDVRSTSENSFNLSQGGGVFVYASNNPNTKWNKFSLGVAYDRTGNFNDSWTALGFNPSTSIAEYFRGFAEGLPLSDISILQGENLSEAYAEIGSLFGFGNQQALLGYEGFLIDPVSDTDDNTSYINNIVGGNYSQNYGLNSTGNSGKMAFNAAAEYNNVLQLGVNLNVHFLNYERNTIMNELNFNAASVVDTAIFENFLRTTASGVSFQLGSIFKVTKEFRAGLTYQSPTWYNVSDETSQSLTYRFNGASSLRPLNPRVVNVYPEYKLRTPGKITGSLAYVFGERGLLSFDYSRKDFSETTFRPTNDPFFAFQNEEMSSLFGVSNSYRLGGEYRYKDFSFRGGYRVEGSAFEDETFGGDLTAYSLGLGYTYGNLTFDIAFSQSERERNEFLYSNAPTFRETANVNTKLTDIVFTLTLGI